MVGHDVIISNMEAIPVSWKKARHLKVESEQQHILPAVQCSTDKNALFQSRIPYSCLVHGILPFSCCGSRSFTSTSTLQFQGHGGSVRDMEDLCVPHYDDKDVWVPNSRPDVDGAIVATSDGWSNNSVDEAFPLDAAHF